MKAETTNSRPFLPSPLDDDWCRWIVGDWEGDGESDTGQGRAVERFEFALNGQFLICRGESAITSISPEQADYLRCNMHAADEEIARFRTLPYRSLEIFTIDPATGDVLAYSFDSLRCIATGRGRREGDRQTIDWKYATGETCTRVTERVDIDRMRIVQRTPMRDGSVLEENGEVTRRHPSGGGNATPDSAEVAVARAFVSAINARDLAAMSALLTEDHTFIDSSGTVVSGRETMLSGWRDYWVMFPDYRIGAESFLQDGATVAMFGTWAATYAGQRGTVPENAAGGPAAWRAVVESGRIKTWQVWADHTHTLEVMKRDADSAAADAP